MVTHSPNNNCGKHELLFFISSVRWERFPGESSRSSYLYWDFGSISESYKKDTLVLSSDEEGRVNALSEGDLVICDIPLCKENVNEYLGYFRLDFSRVDSPPRRAKKDYHPSLSLGGNSSKQWLSREVKGSYCRFSFKQRKMPSPVPSNHEVEEATDEIPLACRPSRHIPTSSKYPLALFFLLFVSKCVAIESLLYCCRF